MKKVKKLNKFLQLPLPERLLIVKAVFLLGAIRIALRWLPFQTLRRLLAKISQPSFKLQNTEPASIDKVVWAVTLARQYVRGVRCLAFSLAIQSLLIQQGCPACLRIGVTRGQEGEVWAHAWVEIQGQAVVESADLSGYSLLPSLLLS